MRRCGRCRRDKAPGQFNQAANGNLQRTCRDCLVSLIKSSIKHLFSMLIDCNNRQGAERYAEGNQQQGEDMG